MICNMGMPITSYTVLKTLAYGGESYEVRAAKEAIKPFNLFAFIIHDSNNHQEFSTELALKFDLFDYITGENLLFFALVDAPEEWIKHAEERKYYREILSLEAREFANPKQSINSNDKSITAFSLANSLNIPTEMLPCIVITDNFDSKKFIWLKTCSRYIKTQLQGLGYLATRYKYKENILEIVKKEDLDLCNGKGEENLEINLAKALSDILSFIVAKNFTSASNQAKQVLSELNKKLREVKDNFSDEETETFDRLCVSIITSLSQLSKRQNLQLENFVNCDSKYLEQDSLQILKTAHKVTDLLESEQNAVAEGIFQEEYDWTPSVICLSKVFEKEINLSVVHAIRKHLGIQLPMYFNKVQPNIYAKRQSGNLLIDFNKSGSNGNWLPPGIGQSEIICRNLNNEGHLRFNRIWSPNEFTLLMTNWENIRSQRNKAAHTEIVNKNSFDSIKNALENLFNANMFEKFYQLKNIFRGN